MGDGGATGAAHDRGCAAVEEEIEAGGTEGAGVVAKDAGGAEAAEDGAVADVVERPGVTSATPVSAASGRPEVPLHLSVRRHGRRAITTQGLETLEQERSRGVDVSVEASPKSINR